MLKRIAAFPKEKKITVDAKTGKKYYYCVIRLPFDDVPGDEGEAIDVWSDVKLGYMRLELVKTPKH